MKKYKWGTNKYYKEAALKKFTQPIFSKCSLMIDTKKKIIKIF